MSIYTRIVITEDLKLSFKPTRLYIKELNGLKYFGKTVRKNIEKYSGSGIHWKNHIKRHGKENIKTLWISEWYYDPHELQEFALIFSEKNNIVESKEWANIKPENGLNGGSTPEIQNNPSTKKKKSDSAKKVQSKIQNDPLVKKKNSDSVKLAFTNPDMKMRHKEACILAQNRPEVKERTSINSRGKNNGRYDSTLHIFYHNSGIIEICTRYDLIRKYNLRESAVSQLLGGSFKSTMGWRFINLKLL